MHERTLGGVERQRDLVEVGEPATEAAQDGIEEVVVGVERAGLERRDVEGERGDDHARDQHRADPERPAREDRRDDREGRRHRELAAPHGLLEGLPPGGDQQRR